MRTLNRKWEVLLFCIFCAIIIAACSSSSPPKKTKSLEQQAFSLYGTFVTAEETAAKIVASPNVREFYKRNIREADAAAKPLADLMLASAEQVAALRNGEDLEELDLALKNLELAFEQARPLILKLLSAIQDSQGEPSTPGRPIP